MYHSTRNPLHRIHRKAKTDDETVDVVKGERRRRLHKAFLRYHDPNNWPLLREALKGMGRSDLIGNGKHHLIPTYQPLVDGSYQSARKKNSTAGTGTAGRAVVSQQGKAYAMNKGKPGQTVARPVADAGLHEPQGDVRFRKPQPQPGRMLTQHTGLPPRAGVGGAARAAGKPAARGAKPAGKPGAAPRGKR